MTRKITLEFLLFILMLLGYSYHLTGNLIHEILGVAIMISLGIHISQSRLWFQNMFKFRAGSRGLVFFNCLLIISMSLVMISGLLISHDLLGFLRLDAGMETRQLHMAAAYWTLIFMAVHLGLYWGRISGWLLKTGAFSAIWIHMLKAGPAVLIASLILGVKASFERKLASKLFFEQAYDFLDFNETHLYYIWLNFIIVVMYVSLAHYAASLLNSRQIFSRFSRKNSHGGNIGK